MWLWTVACTVIYYSVRCFTGSTGASEEQSVKLLVKLIDQLPPPNKKTLEVLLRHLTLWVYTSLNTLYCGGKPEQHWLYWFYYNSSTFSKWHWSCMSRRITSRFRVCQNFALESCMVTLDSRLICYNSLLLLKTAYLFLQLCYVVIGSCLRTIVVVYHKFHTHSKTNRTGLHRVQACIVDPCNQACLCLRIYTANSTTRAMGFY